MTNYIGYEKELQQQLLELKSENKPIILFGTMEMAMFANKALKFLKLQVSCYVDNNSEKWGTDIEGVLVLSPKQAVQQYPSAKIYICSFQSKNIEVITNQLEKMGCVNVYNCDILFYIYQTEVQKRPVLPGKLADTLYLLHNRENKTIVGNINLFITEKCTLNCKDCSSFIPYYKHPKNHDKEIIIEGIKRLSQTVDVIERITILGGEPFLHPDIVEICEEVSRLPNIGYVTITTNGTIVPQSKVIQSLSKYITYINISDYGDLSARKQELVSILSKCYMPYIILGDSETWYKFNLPQQQYRPLDENINIYKTCKWLACSLIISGVYYVCPVAAYVSIFGVITNADGDYIDLMTNEYSVERMKKMMKEYLNSLSCLKTCDYCDFFKEIPVQRALQMVRK